LLTTPEIHLFVADAAVLSSLEFALTVQGFRALDGSLPDDDLSTAAAIVIDVATVPTALQLLQRLRSRGCSAPALFLVTNPTKRDRKQAQASGVAIIEKPLLGDDVSRALHHLLKLEEAA
jgi:CheY-like chemotaxis protein